MSILISIKQYKKENTQPKLLFALILAIIFILTNNTIFLPIRKIHKNGTKRVGVINIPITLNIGDFLVKFSMYKLLEEMGLDATIIVPKRAFNFDLSFLKGEIGSHLLFVKGDFTELNEKDYDYLMVNSDQTWNSIDNERYSNNIALLKFAENWNIKKFIYGASAGRYVFPFRENDKALVKSLLTNFTGISFREKGMVKILKDNLNLKSEFVLDPTFLLGKNHYLNIIKNYKSIFSQDDKFVFIYQLDENYYLEDTIKKANKIFNFKVNKLQLTKSDFMESFIYGMNKSQAVITDSFHGTVFSIIFNKPFITFSNHDRGKARFDSLKEIFCLDKRIIEPSSYKNININLLIEPLNINQSKLSKLKKFSLNYLKKNLDITK